MPGATAAIEIKAKPEPAPAPKPAEDKPPAVAYPCFRAVVFGDACNSTHEQRLAAGWPEDAPLDTPAFLTRPAMTYDVARVVFDLETEPEFTARMVAKDPKIREENARFTDKVLRHNGVQVLMTDEDGHKCVSWNNRHNRPFSEDWARRFAQEHLGGWWVFNGETISIGQEGNALSAQKRLMGFILAVQKWRKDPSKFPAWKTEPVMNCMIVAGVPETPEHIRTLDNGQPRSDADTIISIDEHVLQSWSPTEKKEYGRMLGKATDFLWRRTGAGDIGGEHVYQTPSENAAFRKAHDRIHKAVRHLFDENISGRAITTLKLSAGESAAMCFLMGCSASDRDKYAAKRPRSQDGLDWSLWDKAKEFWSLLAKAETTDEKTGKKSVASVERKAIEAAFKALRDPDDGSEGRSSERLVVLCKAWEKFAAGKGFTADGIKPTYGDEDSLDPDQTNAFGGIDIGPGKEVKLDEDTQEPVLTPDQARAAKRAEVEAQALENAKKAGVQVKAGAPAPTPKEQNAALLKEKNEAKKNGKPVPAGKKPPVKLKLKGGTGK